MYIYIYILYIYIHIYIAAPPPLSVSAYLLFPETHSLFVFVLDTQNKEAVERCSSGTKDIMRRSPNLSRASVSVPIQEHARHMRLKRQSGGGKETHTHTHTHQGHHAERLELFARQVSVESDGAEAEPRGAQRLQHAFKKKNSMHKKN